MLHPTSDRVFVKRIEPATVTSGGIVIPDTVNIKTNGERGMVVSIGCLVKDVKPGDMILFGRYTGTTYIDDKSNEYLIMAENEIQAVCED